MNTSPDAGRGVPAYAGMTWGYAGMTWAVCDTAWGYAGMTWAVCDTAWGYAGMSGGDTAGWCGIRRGGMRE